MISFTDLDDKTTFLIECEESRSDFIKAIIKMPWNNELRTTAETLLVMYDQMVNHFAHQ